MKTTAEVMRGERGQTILKAVNVELRIEFSWFGQAELVRSALASSTWRVSSLDPSEPAPALRVLDDVILLDGWHTVATLTGGKPGAGYVVENQIVTVKGERTARAFVCVVTP